MLALSRRIARRLPERWLRRVKRALAPFQFSRNVGDLLSRQIDPARRRRPVSIVIPSYNDVPYLRTCLRSVAATCTAFDYEIIIVDDYCQPANSGLLRELESDRVSVVFKQERLGFAGTVNVGLGLARHDAVVLNSDTVALPGWLDALQSAAYDVDPLIGLVSPKLVYPNGRIQYAGTYWARLLAPQWFGHLWVGSAATRPAANVPGYNRSVSGACVYVTRAAYDRLGGLDPDFWLGFEDVDWGLRAWDLGIRCYYEPNAMLIHHESATRGYSQGARELASMRYFWRMWGTRFLFARVPDPPRVDFVVGSASSSTWSELVLRAADSLHLLGHETHVHHVRGPDPDESTVSLLGQVDSVKVAADWSAGQTVWLAALPRGRAAYLMSGMESAEHPEDPALQAWIVAHYRPEFDYIAPHRWAADRLRAEAAWESVDEIPPGPALVDPIDESTASAIVSVAAGPELVDWLDELGLSLGAPVVHIADVDPSVDVMERIRRARPRAVVALGSYENSLAVLQIMSLGVAVVARHDERTRYEIMDGFNALLVRPGDRADITRAVLDIMGDADVWRELRENGRSTAERISTTYARRLSRAIHDIAESAT